MNRRFLIIAIALAVLSGSFTDAQETRSVSGIVTGFRKIPLSKVMVFSEKSKDVVYTDPSGMFSVNSANKDKLVVSASGFVKKRIRVTKEDFYRIDLEYVDNPYNFKKAIADGHISEEVLRQAIMSRQTEIEKDYSKYKNIYDLVASEFYNLRVKGTSVVNTKIKSFDVTPEVLLVVDERIVPDISFVLPDDIKKVEFIEDVGATAYGSMGANGVLKITLK